MGPQSLPRTAARSRKSGPHLPEETRSGQADSSAPGWRKCREQGAAPSCQASQPAGCYPANTALRSPEERRPSLGSSAEIITTPTACWPCQGARPVRTGRQNAGKAQELDPSRHLLGTVGSRAEGRASWGHGPAALPWTHACNRSSEPTDLRHLTRVTATCRPSTFSICSAKSADCWLQMPRDGPEPPLPPY